MRLSKVELETSIKTLLLKYHGNKPFCLAPMHAEMLLRNQILI